MPLKFYLIDRSDFPAVSRSEAIDGIEVEIIIRAKRLSICHERASSARVIRDLPSVISHPANVPFCGKERILKEECQGELSVTSGGTWTINRVLAVADCLLGGLSLLPMR